MKMEGVLKKHNKIFKYLQIRKGIFCLITQISPTLNTQLRYRQKFGVFPNLKEPKTFSEKLSWLKLNRYCQDPLVIQCADKYLVREYVVQCGHKELLNELYGVYSSMEEISWDSLPPQFVLKWNFGAGMNMICRDKSDWNIHQVTTQMMEWGKCKFWLPYAEMHYKYIPRKIICERYLEDAKEKDALPDYKVYCFHGEPLAILVMHDRGKTIKSEFFDAQWVPLKNTGKYQEVADPTPRPSCLQQMLQVSRNLSKPFPFVRCDYYVVDERLYFGEMTFTPACGLDVSQTKINGKDMAEYLQIP